MKYSNNWKDYELIDASLGYKYERWNNIFLLRPDPLAMWDNGDLKEKYKNKIDAIYYRSNTGGGYWENINKIPNSWKINYKDLTFNIKQMGFKHTGLFPEQAYNWDLIIEKLKTKENIKALNLFAYTGGATTALAKVKAEVVHVDSSRGMVEWAKENVNASVENPKVRYIVDDVVKFVKREIRRENKYDVIIMDPPSYGRGANKEVWSLEKDLTNLVNLCAQILSDKPLLFIINSYSGLSPIVLENILKQTVNKKYKGKITADELVLKCTSNDYYLPCGIFGRWESD